MTEFEYSDLFGDPSESTEDAFEAGYQARSQEHADDLADLRADIEGIRHSQGLAAQRSAAEQGYEQAQAEQWEAWVQSEAAELTNTFLEGVAEVERHTGKRLSEEDQNRILSHLDDEFSVSDVIHAAREEGFDQFATRAGRLAHLNERLAYEAADD